MRTLTTDGVAGSRTYKRMRWLFREQSEAIAYENKKK